MAYHLINRENIDFTSDTEVCNIGYAEGILADKRPYRLEVWSTYQNTVATFFIDINGFSSKTEDEIKEYLVDNDLFTIIEDDIYITEVTDIDDHTFLSVNVPLLNSGHTINECSIKLKDFNN